MAKHQGALTIELTPKDWETATQASSRSCLIADAIARQYPHLTRIRVDVATIRATDTRTDERLTWIQPQSGAMILLHYDQGWDQPETRRIVTRRPAHVVPVTRSPAQLAKHAAKRAERLAELETKEQSGAKLTQGESAALTRLRNPKPAKPRPSKRGRSTAVVNPDGSGTKRGGEPIWAGSPDPSLLAGRDRLYGGKRVEPSAVFSRAMEDRLGEALPAAVAAEIARMKAAGEL